jgi:hypothetical protein
MSIDDSAAREEVRMNRLQRLSILVVLFLAAFIPTVFAGEQPLAIFHAFNDPFTLVESYVCELAGQGYSHVQISPAQKSNPARAWYARYQPVDFAVIEGMGTESDLKKLTDKAHECGMKVIADVWSSTTCRAWTSTRGLTSFRDLLLLISTGSAASIIQNEIRCGTVGSEATCPIWTSPGRGYRMFRKPT